MKELNSEEFLPKNTWACFSTNITHVDYHVVLKLDGWFSRAQTLA